MVDDDEDDCFIIKEALDESELEHTLTILGSGSELLDYLRGRGKYADIKPEYPDLSCWIFICPVSAEGKSSGT